ncbi:hypothetical protein PC129_g20474 [Phytophthora cactorum]|uniref:Ubiquitin-like protease family profile domain-containing protein n=3 Tax=Phytophthora cactorum TaxID=29920 RepID=A0A8T1H8N9_9STRA|nr:hypothetical protein PC129_g20474 [Phytophthora cactorum]
MMRMTEQVKYTAAPKEKYGNNATIFLPAMKTPVPKTPKKGMRIPPKTLSLVAAVCKRVVFLPLNNNGCHWTCLVVDGATETVYCYDSMDKRTNHNLLADLGDELVKNGLSQAFSITFVLSPIQKDGDSWGLFISLYSWRRFWKVQAAIIRRLGCCAADGMPCVLWWTSATRAKERRRQLNSRGSEAKYD